MFGRYRLLELLGRGSLTESFRAKSAGVEGFEKTLVIKRLLPELARQKAAVDAFVREAQLALRLSHANVVQVFDLGSVEQNGEKNFFIATELVSGMDLSTLLEHSRTLEFELPWSLSLYIVSEIAKALDHAHRRRDQRNRPLPIMHGGVSPKNVLLSWDGQVKLSDFCTSRAVFALEAPGGTVSHDKWKYASPEQLRGEPLEPQSDLFSLGVVFYEMLSGEPPFDQKASDVRAFSARATASKTLDLRPEQLELVDALLKPEPAERTPSAAKLYEDVMAHSYATRSRAGASELGEFLERVKAGRARIPSSSEELRELVLRTQPPAAVAEDQEGASADFSEAPGARPASIPPAALSDQRDVSVLVLHWFSEGALEGEPRERTQQLLNRYGGRVLLESERELAAAFGLEQADGRDTENAVRCALVLARSLANGAGHPAFGITSGRVRVSEGAIAPAEQASLLDRARGFVLEVPRQVAIDVRAARRLRTLFSFAPPSAAHKSAGFRVVEDVRSPLRAYGRFVGRRQELKALADALSQASRRRSQVVVVTGEHGIGKTRLLYEMQRRLVRSSFNVACYIATSPPEGSQEPRSGVLAMLRTLCGLREEDSTDRVAAVEPRLRALGLRGEEVVAVLSELGVSRSSTRAGDPGEALPRAVHRMLQSLCDDSLHIFAWDNAQQLDAESVQILGEVMRGMRENKGLFVLSARPHDPTHLEPLRPFSELSLRGLEEADAARLIALRLGVDQVPEALLAFVRQRAGGHPMFIEELLHEARDSKAIVVEDGEIEALELDGVMAMPRTLRALLLDRIHRLPEMERALMVAAAVLGTPVDTAVLSTMLELPMGNVNALIESLEKQQLVRRTGPVALEFSSALLPEVVVSDLEPDARGALHEAAAKAYQATLGGRAENQAARIAHHLAEAGRRSAAAALFAGSGLYAVESRQFERAANHLSHALDLVELSEADFERLARWIGALTEAVRYVRVSERTLERCLSLAAYVEAHEDLPGRTGVLIDLARVLGAHQHYRDARRLLVDALGAPPASPELSRAALIAESELFVQLGEFGSAVELLERAQGLGSGDEAEQHRLLSALAQALAGAGDTGRALSALDQAARLKMISDRTLDCERARIRATILGFAGDWQASAQAASEAVDLARASGLAAEIAQSLHAEGEALLHGTDRPRAYAVLQAALSAADEIGAARLVNLNRMFLAYLDALNGSEQAQKALGECMATAESSKWTYDILKGRYLLGRLLSERGETEAARRELEIAQRMAETAQALVVAKDCERALGALSS